MTSITIPLSEQMKQYIETCVCAGEYNTPGEYVRELIREDQKKREQEREEALLLRGLESPASAWTHEDLDNAKKLVRERLAAKQNTP